MVLWLGLAISQDSIVGIAWNLEDLLSKLHCNIGPIFKGFGWLQMISCDALGDLLGLGLELEEMRKVNVMLTTRGIRGSPYCLRLMESRYTQIMKFHELRSPSWSLLSSLRATTRSIKIYTSNLRRRQGFEVFNLRGASRNIHPIP